MVAPRLRHPASSRLGRFGTPRPATGSAGSRPARGTPGPGGPGRSSRSRRPGPRAGNRRPRRRASHQQLPGPVEPDDAGGGLRRQPDLGAEPAGQVPLAPAGPGGQLGHPDRAALPQQLVPGPADLRGHVGAAAPSACQASLAEQDLVQHREPLRPAGRGPDPVAQLGAHAAEDGLRGQVEVGELAGRQAEQRPRAQRPQRHLDAGLRARVRDQGRGRSAGRRAGCRTRRAAARGSGCATIVSGSSRVKISVRYGDGRPRCLAGGTPRCR